MGRTGHGVRVIKLREGDYVIGAGVCRPGASVLTITEEGKGRRSRIDDYRITNRGGLGIRNYNNGGVAGIKIVDDTDDLILISQNGILIRIHAADINTQSRYGSGVRVMRLAEGDQGSRCSQRGPRQRGRDRPNRQRGRNRPDPRGTGRHRSRRTRPGSRRGERTERRGINEGYVTFFEKKVTKETFNRITKKDDAEVKSASSFLYFCKSLQPVHVIYD